MGGAEPWQGLRVNLARLRGDVETLSKIGRAPDGNLTRHMFSPSFEEARRWLLGRLEAAGIEGRSDEAGNVLGRVGPAGPAVMSGSHIDTVPDGGPLDGAFGVLSALECARVLKESGAALPRAFRFGAWADEEGWYLNFLGAKAFTGQLKPGQAEAAKAPDGEPLAEVMRRAGFDAARAPEAKQRAKDIAAYVELHIEQGPVLEAKGLPIGVVEAIVGVDHTDFYFRGEPDHAGTTPMDLRKDAFTGAAEFAYKARRMVLRRGTERTRLTYGIVNVKGQAANIVPFEARLRQEMRDTDRKLLGRLVRASYRLAERTAAAHKLSCAIEPISRSEPALMSAPACRRAPAMMPRSSRAWHPPA